MKAANASGRSVLSNEEILAQVQALLEGPQDDLQKVLLKEILVGVLKLSETTLDTLDLKILNRTLKELRYAFRVFYRYRDRPKVSVFGSARTQPDDLNYQLAYQFSRQVVQSGYMVITGGADGIMKAAQEGAGRENSFGVNILLPFEQGANAVIADDPKLITFKYFFTRKLMFQKEANAIALFPGGFGTHDEGFEVLTLAQTGKSNPQPIICLQAPGCDYWNRWHEFIADQLLSRRLINEEDLSLFKILDSAEAAVEEIETFYRNYHSLRFVDRQLAMRIKHQLSADQLAMINQEFSDLLVEGPFEQRGPLPEELDEPALKDLPRLVFLFNRRSAGRLRQLIDRINSFSALVSRTSHAKGLPSN
ncbi:MAG TPA: TIGR00730 family Rossman fold protein [Nitrospiraceae bacterium]|nr:TIGR00730 family Rossman fold protein [Nitrospiraceae bacterium]